VENELAVAFLAPSPISEGHTMVLPKRVVVRFDELDEEEEAAVWRLVRQVRQLLMDSCRPDGLSVGYNEGEAAGQTLAHAHVFMVPRYALTSIRPPRKTSPGPANPAPKEEASATISPPASTRTTAPSDGAPRITSRPKRRWLGIDFSGNVQMWSSGCGNSNVWIATLVESKDKPAIADLRPVQDLEGEGPPFERLAALLGRGDFEAAAIDAPFSLPALTVPGADHLQLLRAITYLDAGGAPFPSGAQLLEAFGSAENENGTKQLRVSEDLWQSRGINVRAALWNGARPGAPMTSACLKLLALAERPVWPFAPPQPGCLVEAFPAAQLKTWGIPYTRYTGTGSIAVPNRQYMVKKLARRMDFNGNRSQLIQNDNALDAAVAAFAAVAVTEDRLAFPPSELASIEGWIAVHV
jgi:diadenosine tetraphosphate (Ap4A) HIT family hydrolase